CCCEPLMTTPGSTESAMKPPLEKFGPEQKSNSVVRPLSICTRRMGAACEAAQNSATPSQPPFGPGAMWTVRLERDRQKFVSAPAEPRLCTSIVPVIATSPG